MTVPSPIAKRPTSLAVAAAVAAVAVLSSAGVARAQNQVGGTGRLNDASNRAGSGGYNGAGVSHYQAGAYQAQIGTGNVTGLDYFHGNTGTFDTSTVHVNTQDAAVQAFTQYSAPVNYAQRSTGQSLFTSYYNTAQYAPTVGAADSMGSTYSTTKNNVGIYGTQPTDALVPSTDVRLQNLNDSITDMNSNLPTRLQADSAGPVNPVGDPQLYSMSPLYGIRQLEPDDTTAGDPAASQRYVQTTRTIGNGPHADAASIQRMQAEVNDPLLPNRQSAGQQQPIDGSVLSGANTDAAATSLNIGSTAVTDANAGRQVPIGQVPSAMAPSSALPSAVAGQQSPLTSPNGLALSRTSQQLMIAPGQQSAQLAELQRRFAANTPNPTAPQAQRQLTQETLMVREMREQRARADASLKPGGAAGGDGTLGTDTGTGGMGGPAPRTNAGALMPATPGGTKSDTMSTVVKEPTDAANDRPYIISSLATGTKANGLADLLRTGEQQMRDGKFIQAVDTYDTAGEVARNNPFVPLGRGFAELGASFYGRAESDLTRAITMSPYVLFGQYDLTGFLGDARLKFVQQDLTGIASTERSARPHLLLAYIAHNTGQDDAKVTAPQLDLAEQLGGDPKVIGMMREAWKLKAAPSSSASPTK